METKQAIGHFGSIAALAKALNIKPQAVYQWGAFVPRARAFELQIITGGVLRIEEKDVSPKREQMAI